MRKTLAAALVLFVLVQTSRPCSFCELRGQRDCLLREMQRADFVVLGRAVASKLNGGAGAGATDFEVTQVVKNHAFLAGKKTLVLPRYVPILDPKDPPQFLLFCFAEKDKLNPFLGKQVRGDAVVGYLQGAAKVPESDRVKALLYYEKYLDHADEVVAADAFLELARSDDADVGAVAKHMTAGRLRTLLQNHKNDPDRTSLFAFLLGNCGGAQDADYLLKRIQQAKEDDYRALDGLLGGYIALRPKEGWRLTHEMLANPKNLFTKRYAAMRTVRFYQGWKPAETKPTMLASYGVLVHDGEIADLAIEDLRRWKVWDLTGDILAQFGKPTHQAPIIRRGIVRYALTCPLPEVQRFVETVRRQDQELVRDIEEALQFEKATK